MVLQNTIHEFDFTTGGKWLLTMHGPRKGNYETSSVFSSVEPLQKITLEKSIPTIILYGSWFQKSPDTSTEISFTMIFGNS